LTRIKRRRSKDWLVATAVASAVAACAPPPRLIAVAGEESVLVYHADLTPHSTIPLHAAGSEHFRPTSLLFSGDGTSLLIALETDTGGVLIQLGRFQGAGFRRVTLHGERPHHLIPFPGGKRFLTVGTEPSDSNGSPHGVASIITLTHKTSDRVRLDVCRGRPMGAVIHRDAEKVYIVCDTDSVAEVDATLERVVRLSTLGDEVGSASSCAPAGAALSHNGTVLFVPCRESGWLLYLDRVTLVPFDSVEIGPEALNVTVAPRLQGAVVPVGSGDVLIIDTARRQVAATLHLDAPSRDLAVSADGKWLYTLEGDGGRETVARLAPITARLAATVRVPVQSAALAVWPGVEASVLTWLADVRQPQ
jgi:DNA-binding beta-propeller fold protein YncE